MDSSSCDHLPSLRSLACGVKYPYGNYLIHQFVLNNSKPSTTSCSESDICAALRSFPDDRVNETNEDGYTALHLAVTRRNSFMVKMLLSCLTTIDVNVRCRKAYGGTALHIAANEDYIDPAFSNAERNDGKNAPDEAGKECIEIVKVLVEASADIDITDNCGKTPIHVAAKGNQIDLIKVLIGSGAELNIKDGNGYTPLHHAIWESRLETVKLLVESGADVDGKCALGGSTPFHLEIDMNIIDYIIARQVYSNSVDRGYTTPLHVAAKGNKIDAIKLLIRLGAKLNIKDELDRTPLHYAIKASLEAVKLLTESGADVNTECIFDGLTPFHVAVRAGLRDIFEYLINKSNAVVASNTVDTHGNAPLHSAVRIGSLEMVNDLVRNGACIDSRNNRGETPLCVAAEENKTDLIKFLIWKNANMNIKDCKGCTPLHHAIDIGNDRPLGDAIKKSGFEGVKLLVESGAEMNEKSNLGHTPFHLAVERNLRDLIKYFISKKVDLNTVSIQSGTPLHSAVRTGSLETVNDLVENGARLNMKDYRGRTPLHVAAQENRIDVMSKFLIDTADVNPKDSIGSTPLHIAAAYYNIGVVRILISNGADVNAENSYGRTPLHEALSSTVAWRRKDCFEVVEVLVKSGALVYAEDKSGETALNIAERRRFNDIFEFLKSRDSLLEAASSNTTVFGEPPFKKSRTGET